MNLQAKKYENKSVLIGFQFQGRKKILTRFHVNNSNHKLLNIQSNYIRLNVNAFRPALCCMILLCFLLFSLILLFSYAEGFTNRERVLVSIIFEPEMCDYETISHLLVMSLKIISCLQKIDLR